MVIGASVGSVSQSGNKVPAGERLVNGTKDSLRNTLVVRPTQDTGISIASFAQPTHAASRRPKLPWLDGKRSAPSAPAPETATSPVLRRQSLNLSTRTTSEDSIYQTAASQIKPRIKKRCDAPVNRAVMAKSPVHVSSSSRRKGQSAAKGLSVKTKPPAEAFHLPTYSATAGESDDTSTVSSYPKGDDPLFQKARTPANGVRLLPSSSIYSKRDDESLRTNGSSNKSDVISTGDVSPRAMQRNVIPRPSPPEKPMPALITNTPSTLTALTPDPEKPEPPPTQLKRKATLHALPHHLMGPTPSSSSSENRFDLSGRRISIKRSASVLDRNVKNLDTLVGEVFEAARAIDIPQSSPLNHDVRRQPTVNASPTPIVESRAVCPLVLSGSDLSNSSDDELDSNMSSTPPMSHHQSYETLPTNLTKSTTPSMQAVLQKQDLAVPVRRSSLKHKETPVDLSHPLFKPISSHSLVKDYAYAGDRVPRRTSSFPVDKGAAGPAEDFPKKIDAVNVPLASSVQPRIRPAEPFNIRPKVTSKRVQPASKFSPAHQHWQVPKFAESPYYHLAERTQQGQTVGGDASAANDATSPFDDKHETIKRRESGTASSTSNPRCVDLRQPRRNHVNLRDGQGFSLGRHHRRQPIAREWNQTRKSITATIACLNTIFTGLLVGIYAGEVPRIQYQLADMSHWVLNGNVVLFAALGLSTLIFWPLPLLHGRKPYVLLAFALMLPLQFPQAMVVTGYRSPGLQYRVGLFLPRAISGFALGFANINFLPTLLDLFGASLMSEKPHQEFVMFDDVRRQGGGMGIWLGIWTCCFSSSLSMGFCVGACIISNLDAAWGFYIVMILLALFLLINVLAPETRRSAYRRSIAHFFDQDDPEKLRRRIARGEVKLHISNEGPKWWYQEVFAGMILVKRIVLQPGFFVLMVYLGWLQAQLTLVILFLGALLSRDYKWKSQYVGLAALAIPIGAALAMPLTKASWFSRSRSGPPRTDSMTFEKRITWSSHLVRRTIFTLTLPLAGLGYCLSAPGPPTSWVGAVIFAGVIGFLTDLGIAECVGLIMETFDSCDLQPGANTPHRVNSMSASNRRRRTNYSSFPRVCAGFFAAQSLSFFLAAAATGISGRVTNAYGAQKSIAIVASVLLFVTILLCGALWRWKEVQVIPSYTAGLNTRENRNCGAGEEADLDWTPVIIGNPSGKIRRMNLLELGRWSRWSEIRRLNKLVKDD